MVAKFVLVPESRSACFQGSSAGALSKERLPAEEAQQAATASGKKGSASKKKKQPAQVPQLSSPSTSSQESASTTVSAALLNSHYYAALSSAMITARPVVGSHERYGPEYFADLEAEYGGRPKPAELPGFTGLPEDDIAKAFEEDYSKQYELLLAEEAAAEAAAAGPSASTTGADGLSSIDPAQASDPPKAAESAKSSMAADSSKPQVFAGQVSSETAALRDSIRAAQTGTPETPPRVKEEMRKLLAEGESPALLQCSPLQSEGLPCSVYPDDFMVDCGTASQAAAACAVTVCWPPAAGQADEQLSEGDPMAGLMNYQGLLSRAICCPLSGVCTNRPSACSPTCA